MKKLVVILCVLVLFMQASCRLRYLGSRDVHNTVLIEMTSNDTLASLIDTAMESESETVLMMESNYIMVGSGSGYGSGSGVHSAKTIVEIPSKSKVHETAEVSTGRVAYDIPDTMKVMTSYTVTLRISKSKSIVVLTDDMTGTVRTSVIPVTQTMEVKLVDPMKAFDIVADNDGEQFIDDSTTYTQWSWTVTPLKPGSSKLKIVIAIVRNGSKKETVYEDSILVQRDVVKQTGTFFEKYWQWLIGTLILPFGIWLYKKRDKKDDKKKDDN